MACRGLREAAHPLQRLQSSSAAAAVGCGDRRPPGGQAHPGVYPLLEDDTCAFLAVDFDEAVWREDVRAFAQSCDQLGVPVTLEISRAGRGAHAWVFFDGWVAARDARRLGTALISHTCARTRRVTLSSYDRLFPNQDSLPKGGFGNLITAAAEEAA